MLEDKGVEQNIAGRASGNMIGPSSQRLNRRIPNKQTLIAEAGAWEKE